MGVKIVSVEQMRALERAAFAAGVSEAALQEVAGRAVAEEVAALASPGQRVAVLVGPGNNGRDGAVAARYLARAGIGLDLLLAPRHAVRDDELAALRAGGVRVRDAAQAGDLDQALARARVAVDGLTGIGAHGPLREPLAAFAARLNEARRVERGSGELDVVAIDVPSGVDADSGAVPGEAVWADVTVTLGAIKQGLLLFPAAERAGRVVCRDIGIPADALARLPCELLDEAAVAPLVPPRPLDAHKYRFGRALVVAGSAHFLGAPILCATAAARSGAGLVTVGAPAAVRGAVAGHTPEITYAPRDVDPERDPDAGLEALGPLLEACDVLALGPGLGRADGTQRFVRGLLERRARVAPASPAVVDADALFVLAEWPEWWAHTGPNVVLTPHSGELARLAGPRPASETPWVEAARLSGAWGVVLVAKGPFTSVARPDGRVAVWPRANPALATGGTGDVLVGMVAGLIAQGATPFDAARLAVAAHGLAAQAVLDRTGWRSLLASDLLPEIPRVLARLGASR
jgi:ADP-dependent NAD(P)H-hydrate dehydratase / NAD(P)H-hydrate epimerase